MKAFATVVASLLLAPIGSMSMAQDTKHAEAAAPALFPEGYLDREAIGAALKKAAAEGRGRVRIESIARTGGGRDVWMATLGAAEKGKTKPAILVVANLEADHLVGTEIALRLVERIAKAPEGDQTAAILDKVTVFVVPRLNPDGAVGSRLNLRPVDRDRDGKQGEDGPDDLDGDGVTVRMRAKDKEATLVADAADGRLLRKADASKGERAVYSDYPEGRDDDGDGRFNEDPSGGVNLNRNWPHLWAEFDVEAGTSPASEPEVRGLIAFAYAHPEIAAVWALGLEDNIKVEPKKPGSTLDDADLPLLAELSRAYGKASKTSKGVPKAKEGKEGKSAKDGPSKPAANSTAPGGSADLAATSGGSLADWAYHQFGAVGIASRPWAKPEVPESSAEGEARWLEWNDKVMGGRAFVPWKEVDHPTLGKVEVGGWRPGVRINPPIGRVEPLADAHLAFLADLAGRAARLEWVDVKVEAKGGGLFAIEATVINPGYLPTAMAQGVRTRQAPPVLVRLDPKAGKILAGRALERVESLAGSGGRREFRWLVLATEGGAVALEATSPRAGSAVRSVDLK